MSTEDGPSPSVLRGLPDERRTPRHIRRMQQFTTIAVIVCISSFVYAVVKNSPSDAGRGGAFAIVITFLMLFVKSKTPLRTLEEGRQSNSDPVPVERDDIDLYLDVGKLLFSLRLHLALEDGDSAYLAITSIIGTLSWGFADVPVRWLHCTVFGHWLGSCLQN